MIKAGRMDFDGSTTDDDCTEDEEDTKRAVVACGNNVNNGDSKTRWYVCKRQATCINKLRAELMEKTRFKSIIDLLYFPIKIDDRKSIDINR